MRPGFIFTKRFEVIDEIVKSGLVGIGASIGSADVHRTLRRLCHELIVGMGIAAKIPDDPQKVRTAFSEIVIRRFAFGSK